MTAVELQTPPALGERYFWSVTVRYPKPFGTSGIAVRTFRGAEDFKARVLAEFPDAEVTISNLTSEAAS